MSVQVVPFNEYCQTPLLFDTAVTAMPRLSPSTSLAVPAPDARMADTVVPALAVSSSDMAGRLRAVVPSTGASLTAVTSMVMVLPAE